MMKTTKSVKNVGKVIRKEKAVRTNKVVERNKKPSEEEIRIKANEIYEQRIERGEQDTAENDWFKAEQYLSDEDN